MILRDAMMAGGSSRELLKIALLRLESGAAETACAQAAGTQIPKLASVESTATECKPGPEGHWQDSPPARQVTGRSGLGLGLALLL